MNKQITFLISSLLLVLLVGTFLAACGQSSPASSNPPATSSSGGTGSTLDGQTLLQQRCAVCHDLSRVTSAHKTADQWRTTVERMVGKDAQLNAQEQQTLVDYLAQTYP